MPKFARPNAYTGKQANSNWTGQSRFANEDEALAGVSDQLIISPALLADIGQDVILSAPAAGTAGASPREMNSKIGQVIFSSVSIAAADTQSFVVTNSEVAVGKIVLAQIYGATTGSALTIQSVTPASGSFTIVVMNGTGATTTTANLTVTFMVIE